MPVDGLDGLAIDLVSVLSTPECADEVLILFDVQVEFACLVVFELGVVDGLLRDASATPEPDALNFEVGLISEHQVSSEAVLAEIVEALEETIAQVVGDVEFFALTLVLVVVEEPQRETGRVELLLEFLDTFALLVFDVDEERLEVEQVEGGGREKIEGICGLLLGLIFIIIVVFRFSGCSFLSWGSYLLLFSFDDGLDSLGSNLDVTGNSHELGKSGDTFKPGGELWHCLSESTVKECLLGNNEKACKCDIGESDGVSNKPVTSESAIDGLGIGFYFIERSGEVGLVNVGPSVDGLNCWHLVRDEFSHTPEAPLVDLCALDVVGAEKSSVAMGQILSDGNRLANGALGSLEEWELSSSVQCFEFFGVLGLFRDNLDLECLSVDFGGDSSDEGVEVEGVVDVDFLNES